MSILQFFAIPFGLGMIVIGAGIGIGNLALPTRSPAPSTCRCSSSKASRFWGRSLRCSCCFSDVRNRDQLPDMRRSLWTTH
jgi:hypothetical protein